jgi:hypothetical protein
MLFAVRTVRRCLNFPIHSALPKQTIVINKLASSRHATELVSHSAALVAQRISFIASIITLPFYCPDLLLEEIDVGFRRRHFGQFREKFRPTHIK